MPLNLLHSNDQQGRHAPSWYAETLPKQEVRAPLEGNIQCDVCIVGGGLTGLSAALHLARRGYSVTVLEAHLAGWGASGRNGGQVGSGQRQDQFYLEKHYGEDAARQYWQIGEEAKALVRELAGQSDIECHIAQGIVHADHRNRYLKESRETVDLLNSKYGYEAIRYLDGDEITDYVKSPRYFGGTLDSDAFHIHPLALATGIARQAEKSGVTIFENSEVTKFEKGGKVVCHTSNGSVKANMLILACNGYLGNLEPNIAARVLPINNFVITTEPLSKDQRAEVMPGSAAVADSKFVVNYFRMTHDDRLLFGGGENYGYQFPGDIRSFVRKPMLDIFPQLKDVRIDHGWGGTLAITQNRLPLFKKVSDNILNCSGYSGQGVALSVMAGNIASQAVAGQMEQFDLMSKLKTPRFPGGTMLRYPMLIAAMTWFSIRDKF